MGVPGLAALFTLIVLGFAAAVAVLVTMYVVVPLFQGIGFLIGHVGRFIGGMIRDTFRAVGAIPAAVVFALLCVATVVIGRWSSAAHYGANLQYELKSLAGCLYRIVLSHPLRLIGLGSMLEGLESRVPAAVAEAPGADRPARRSGVFDGYTIVGSLPGGGSGGRLYIAQPQPAKRQRLIQINGGCPDRVVIKSFAIDDGSTLPQIVRESRALECARQIGLVLEHELTEDRFFYVMPYVPGEHLGAAVRHAHAQSDGKGLGERPLREVLGYLADVVATLDHYHRGGLWHKDVKPENIIIHAGRAHVVDLGLVTPLRSAMTLTTHGTEYFRDPEMVRLALRGVKVHEVDGAKFDVYGAGAVLYYAIQNDFPAHGGLSTITKRCPEAVKWIVRRAMTDYHQRYASAEVLLADLDAVRRHPNVWSMKPAELPSMAEDGVESGSGVGGHDSAHSPGTPVPGSGTPVPGFAAFTPVAAATTPPPPLHLTPPRSRPALRVTNWWTGRYAAGSGVRDQGSFVNGRQPEPRLPNPEPRLRTPRPPASEQLVSARRRIAERRRRAWTARHRVHAPAERINAGMIIAAFLVVGAVIFVAISSAYWGASAAARRHSVVAANNGAAAAAPTIARSDSRQGRASDRSSVPTLVPLADELRAHVSNLPPNYLIINDHPHLRVPAVREYVDEIEVRLRDLGFSPVEDADLAATLESRLRSEHNLLKSAAPEEGDARMLASLSTLLAEDEQLADLGCVVWLSHNGPSNAEGRTTNEVEIITWIVTPEAGAPALDTRLHVWLTGKR